MKLVKRTLFTLLTVLLILTGCRLSHDSFLDLAICGSYGVPGMLCADLKGGNFDCEVLEIDSQGRTLFSYTTRNVITEKEETAIVICQVIDSECVYFYEDRCYIFGNPTASEFVSLKEQNDWNCELDYRKMVSRCKEVSFDLFLVVESGLEYSNVCSACSKELNIEQAQIKELCILDKDSNNHELYWLVLERNGIFEKYCILVDSNYKIAYMKAQGSLEDCAKIASFKQRNGWETISGEKTGDGSLS